MAFMHYLLTVAIMAHLLLETRAFPGGAPEAQCRGMTPGHGDAQTTPSPYNLTVSSNTYTPLVPITVTVTGGFKGIMLQVREEEQQFDIPLIFGEFDAPDPVTNLTLLPCLGNTNGAISHSGNAVKDEAVLTWNPPNSDQGPVQFVATIVKLYDQASNPVQSEWWFQVKSDVLTFKAAPTQPTPQPVPTTTEAANCANTYVAYTVMYALAIITASLFL